MDAMAALKGRRSIRSYEDRPVPKETLEEIIDAARLAPTANNTQPWEFIVVTEADVRTRIADLTDYGKFIAQAGACVVVFAREVKRKHEIKPSFFRGLPKPAGLSRERRSCRAPQTNFGSLLQTCPLPAGKPFEPNRIRLP